LTRNTIKKFILLSAVFLFTATNLSAVTGSSSGDISSITGPDTVIQGQTIEVTVEYTAPEDKDLYLRFQNNHAPWYGYIKRRLQIEAGSTSATFTVDIPISDVDMPVADDYLIQVIIVPTDGGWVDREGIGHINPVEVLEEGSILLPDDDTPQSTSGSIKPIDFTWEDGDTTQYYNGMGRKQAPLTARIKTMTFFDPNIGVMRTIENNFKLPDDYEFTSPTSKRLSIKNNGSTPSETVPLGGSPTWDARAIAAFSDTNLNHYIEGSRGGSETKYGDTPDPTTVRHLLKYTEGVKVGNGGDGYVIVSERGGNNSFYLLARDMQGEILGSIFIRRASTIHCSDDNRPAYGSKGAKIDNNYDYYPSGRMQENIQEICVAVYPIQEMAAPGSVIGSIEMWAATEDVGDGKVMLITYLDEPEVCYDYTVRQNGHTLHAEDRNFTASNHGDVHISLGLKSLMTDYNMTKSKLRIFASPLSFNKAAFSPDSINAYLPATYIHGSGTPEIAIGHDITPTSNGGTIASKDRYFSKFTFNPPSQGGNIQFNFDLNVTIDTSEAQNNPLTYMLTSDPLKYNDPEGIYKELKRCPVSEVYNPTWGQFNVERIDSDNFTNPNEKYPLYTQAAGKPFDFSVVAYDGNSSIEKAIDKTTVEVEVIDVSSYNDAETYFKCNDPAHEIVTDIGDNGSIFVAFAPTGEDVSRIDNAVVVDKALRSAAFRLWTLHDRNGTLISHTCDSKADNICFNRLYEEFLSNEDAEKYCNNCATYPEGCYECLKIYFGRPTCSRDNFSIRPTSYSIKVSDINESNLSATSPLFTELFIGNNHDDPSPHMLSAGYAYKIDAAATTYGTNDPVEGYTQDFMGMGSRNLISNLGFKDSGPSCADEEDHALAMRFFNGMIKGNIDDSTDGSATNTYAHTNVGNYAYHIEDLNWTRVDQDRSRTKLGEPLKTFPGSDDCEGMDSLGSATYDETRYSVPAERNSRMGCGISSISTSGGKTYKDMPLQYQPYAFDLTQVFNVQRPNKNILFMNDFTNPFYDPILSTKLTMSTSFEGNVTAIGKKDNMRLSNFTTGCMASAVTLDLNRTMSPEEDTITVAMPLQQYLEVGIVVENKVEGMGTLTLPQTAFENEDNGSAAIRLHTTLKKPTGEGSEVNPIQVNYKVLKASDERATSTTHMSPNYVPEGNNTYDLNTTFVYGKITPGKRLYDNVETNFLMTPIFVDIFCDETNAARPLPDGECANRYGLDTKTKGENESTGWQQATIYDADELGHTTIEASHFGGENANPFVSFNDGVKDTTINDVPFDDPQATQNDINVSVEGSERNSMVKVEYAPVPWLIYDDETDFYRVHFIGGTAWAGVGKTGHVTDTASSETKNDRMSW